ncbi:acyl-CoA dehydrogenase family protein [Pseudonocardia halophobica]|uniref:Acyl-CoA dehydrogenase n=1 Tax=Pseudonocardia halophobica TaxID=29401 RepID=A0A9W6L8H8_9PSEU|nr:acyl-CoA dehydrogenase family protein [Pseudonocardia halophobica]GLL12939.1 acyl-CoA dehydrogenase [Pseudonocardia halophobica]
MDFSLTAEQQLLRDSLADWLADRYDLARSREAAASEAGWQPEVWRAFADDLGILGATLPEEVGGSGGGPVEAMVIAEQLGRALVVEPYVDTVVLGGGVLRRLPGAGDVLKGVVAGSVRIAPGLLEPTSGHTAHSVATTARRDGGDWVLTGAKAVVPGVPQATHLLLTARTSGEQRDLDGISIFLLPVELPGLQVHRYRTIDDRHAADLVLDDVQVPADALLGEEGRGWTALAPALDEALAALTAEAVGCMRTVLADTVAYSKERRQFGQPIGSFQALQHRMVDMHLEVEQSVAAMYLATLRLGAEPAERARATSAAKVTVSRAARFVGQNAVQLHGGMGMTQELAIGHYFKRLTAIEYELGPADHHRSRYASLTPKPRSAERGED